MKAMQKTLILSIAAILGLASVVLGSSGKTLMGSGRLVTRTIPVIAFNEVNVSRSVRVILTEGASGQLTVEADDNLIDHVVAKVAKGKLTIGIDPKIKSVSNVHVTITVPTDGRIESLEASSAAEIYTQNIVLTGPEVEIEASSAATINVSIAADQCKADASSAATIQLKGSARTCEADINSAATLNAQKFEAVIWDIEASSGSNARIHCTGTLKAHASSGASIAYTGDCTTDTYASSGGSIRKR